VTGIVSAAPRNFPTNMLLPGHRDGDSAHAYASSMFGIVNEANLSMVYSAAGLPTWGSNAGFPHHQHRSPAAQSANHSSFGPAAGSNSQYVDASMMYSPAAWGSNAGFPHHQHRSPAANHFSFGAAVGSNSQFGDAVQPVVKKLRTHGAAELTSSFCFHVVSLFFFLLPFLRARSQSKQCYINRGVEQKGELARGVSAFLEHFEFTEFCSARKRGGVFSGSQVVAQRMLEEVARKYEIPNSQTAMHS
jgi:hypothetical protein